MGVFLPLRNKLLHLRNPPEYVLAADEPDDIINRYKLYVILCIRPAEGSLYQSLLQHPVAVVPKENLQYLPVSVTKEKHALFEEFTMHLLLDEFAQPAPVLPGIGHARTYVVFVGFEIILKKHTGLPSCP